MSGQSLRKRFALTEAGARNVAVGAGWTVAVNLANFAAIGMLFSLMSRLLATLVEGAPLPDLALYALGSVGFVALSFALHLMQYRNTYGSVYGEVREVRLGIAEHLRRLPLSFFGTRDLADLSETIMSDVDRLEHVWSHVLSYLAGAFVSTGIAAVGSLFFDWRLAIAAFWAVPVAFGLLFGMRSHVQAISEESKRRTLELSDDVQETLDCVREIWATNQTEHYLSRIYAGADEVERVIERAELGMGLAVNGASMIMRLGVATTILAGAVLISRGEVDFMTYFGFLLLVARIYAPFDQALALIAELFISDVSARRLQSIYDEPAAVGTMAFEPRGHDIVFEGVTFSYGGDAVLRGVGFVAREGEVTALVGPSGSGKSTCARLAARLWDADGGVVSVGGVDVSTVDPEVLMGDFSMVFQDVTLFDDTVIENIRIGRRGATDDEVLAAARAANCDEFVLGLPDGYHTRIGENGSRLSGGERQRISIARALLKDAPILLLDEATASLDSENETRVQEAISLLTAGKTVLVIAHRMRTVQSADKVVVLDAGRVVEQGAPAELLATGGMFARMTHLQHESASWSL